VKKFLASALIQMSGWSGAGRGNLVLFMCGLLKKFLHCLPCLSFFKLFYNVNYGELYALQRKSIYVFPDKELRGLSLIFSCSRIGKPIVEIYQSLTDT